jgi:hypothetical protein
MISTAIMRRIGPLLVGLYVVAQICGVAPLMSCDSAHVAAATHMLYECKRTGALPQEDHHHAGDADDTAQHHVLLDLNGVLIQSFVVVNSVAHFEMEASTPRSLAEADVVLLERPPKPFLSV